MVKRWLPRAALHGAAAGLLTLSAAARAGAEPLLKIAGSDADGVRLAPLSPAIRHAFHVLAVNAERVSDLRVEVAPLEDEAGNEVPGTTWKWIGAQEGEVALDAPRVFEVRARLPRPGTYRTDLDLVYAGKRTSTRLTVAFAGAPGVEAVGSQGVRVEKGRGEERVAFALVLRETEGAARQLEPPALSFLSMTEGTARFQKTGGSFSLGEGAPALAPNEQRSFAATLGGLDEAGQYEGSVRLGVEGRRPLDVPFTVTVKESRWMAAGLIAVGVIASHLIRLWRGSSRKRLAIRRDLDRVARDVDARATGPSDAREQRILAAFRRRLEELREDLALDVEVDVGAELEVLASKLTVFDAWREQRRRVAQLGAEAADPLFSQLGAVADILERAGADDEDVEEAAEALADVDVRSAERADLAAALGDLEKDVEREKKTATRPLAARLDAEVAPLVRKAWLLLGKDAVDEARAAVDEARKLYARTLAAALRGRLQGAAPRGFAAEGWKALRESLGPRLDEAERQASASAAAVAYTSAARDYLIAAAEALVKEGATLAEVLAGKDIAGKAAHEDRLTRVRARIEETLAVAKGPAWPEAAAMEADLERQLAEVEGALYPTTPEAFLEIAGVAWSPGVIPELAARPAKQAPPPAPERIAARIRSYDAAVTFVILIVAVATGIKVLWAGNPVWGGFEARLVAVLWGLGLHQLGNLPFKELLEKLPNRDRQRADSEWNRDRQGAPWNRDRQGADSEGEES